MLPPLELIRQMTIAGRRLVALTDHDTLVGVREIRAIADAATGSDAVALQLVAGVEINSVTDDPTLWEGELHILGFGMDEGDAAFEAALERQRAGRTTRISAMLERLRRLGIPVDAEFAQVVAGADPSSIGRPHVARAMVVAGHAASVDDAFRDVLARGQPGYVPRQGLGPREAIDAIRAAGGLPVLAHFRETLKRPLLIDKLVRWGLGGLEVHYGGHGRPFSPELVAAIERFAAERGLVATGGSDYHGDEMAYPEATAALRVPDAVGPPFLAALAAARAGR
ncbi:MAG: PHP domain-containing protein [Candidatus Limnocylindrales bacterium]